MELKEIQNGSIPGVSWLSKDQLLVFLSKLKPSCKLCSRSSYLLKETLSNWHKEAIKQDELADLEGIKDSINSFKKYALEVFDSIQRIYNDTSSVVDGYSSNQFDRLVTSLMFVALTILRDVNPDAFSLMYLQLDGIRLRLESRDELKKKTAWWFWKKVSLMQGLELEEFNEFVMLTDDWMWEDSGKDKNKASIV